MKKIIIAISMLVSLSAFAGPEEHKANQTCYFLRTVGGQYVAPSIPQEICLEELAIDPMNQKMYVTSYFQSKLFEKISVFYFVRKNEDAYTFLSSARLFEDGNITCSDHETTTMNISGQVDIYGTGDVKALKIMVANDRTTDSCHSPGETQEYNYSR